jgi:hypothetical protein
MGMIEQQLSLWAQCGALERVPHCASVPERLQDNGTHDRKGLCSLRQSSTAHFA